MMSLALLAVLGLGLTGMSQTGKVHSIVRIALKNYSKQMKQLQALEFDIAGVDLKSKSVDLVVTPDQVDQLNQLGFNAQVLRSQSTLTKPDASYQTPEKVEALLKKYEATYPDLAKVVSAGKSLQGRDIWAIKITSHVNQEDPSKPHIFFNGMHHAREVMSVEVPLDTINTLLTQYGKDSKVTHWVDSNEIWILPMFNVDGNNKVWNGDSMWRKNARGNYGVDINRNYPFAWNSCNGSSSSQGAQDYHGASAASEPETQVMMNFVKMIRPVFSISYHSYSEIVIYPYGCDGQHVPTKEVVEGIGAELASKIVSDNGKDHYTAGTAPELLYSVDGGDIDWYYHEYQVIPYVIEVNSTGQGFQPSYTKWRDSTVARVKPGWQFLLDKLDGPSIHGQVQDANQKGVAGATLHIERTSGGAAFTQDYPAQDNGYFDVILPSGVFKVTFSAPNLKATTQTIHVDNARVDVNAALARK